MKIGVIGAGSMGTALSQIIADNSENLLLYARRIDVCDSINKIGFNKSYYPNIKLNNKITAINRLSDLKDRDIIFLCVPSSTVRQIMKELNEHISDDCIIVSTAKGLEKRTNKRMSEIIEEYTNRPAVALSGPNIANEMMNQLFTVTTIASKSDKYLEITKKALSSDKFKVGCNNDVVGTEFCGIIKNILAISQGIFEGMDINNNAKYGIFTKSYLETKEIIEKLGGNRDTVDEYCGFGDIITASTLSVSRNHTLGVLRGQGLIIDEKASGVLFEGKNTSIIIKQICDDFNINSLTVNFVYDVIIKNRNPREAFDEIWSEL